jgi:hypothetical protein
MHYRIYLMDADNHIQTAESFASKNDRKAKKSPWRSTEAVRQH